MTSKPILESIEESRKELLDLSLRNPLLNYRPLRVRGVEMVGENAAQVFKTLVADGRPMSFLPGRESPGVQSEWTDEDGFNAGQPEDVTAAPIRTDQSDRRLQTAETSENLQKRLLNTYRLANTSIEETGVNTLFMALGMLRWYEADQSQEERKAPLVLVPVRLERAGVRENFRVAYNEEDIGANLSLVEKTNADFGLVLPGRDEVEQITDGTISIGNYFNLVGDAVLKFGLRRWRVDPDSVALGFFTYNKIMMYRDLDDAVWPDGGGIAENQIINALFGDGFAEPSPTILGDDHLDDHLGPQDAYHILDADSSQSLAINDALGNGGTGRNLVVQGPPGTGKSQTIANIIAEAVGRGKGVLFVAEKMAALEVVKRRLDTIGLGDTCLELHSHKTNKRETLDNLGRTLNSQATAVGGGSVLEDLGLARSQLNDYADAVNTPVEASGVTPYNAFGQLLALNSTTKSNSNPNPIFWESISGPDSRMKLWTGADFNRKRGVVEELRLRLQRTGIPNQHTFWGCRLRSLLPAGQASLLSKIDAASLALENLANSSGALADDLALDRPAIAPDFMAKASALLDTAGCVTGAPDLGGLNLAAPQWQSVPGQIKDLVAKGLRWRRIHSEHDTYLLLEAWETDLRQARQVLNTTGRSFFGRLLSSSHRQARQELASVLTGELPRTADQQIALIDAIGTEQQLRAELGFLDSGRKRLAAVALGTRWAGSATDWDTVVPIVDWWLNLQAGVSAGRVSSDVVRVLQNRTSSGHGVTQLPPLEERQDHGLVRTTDEVNRSLSTYRAHVAELQSALGMDNQARFRDTAGLTALPLLEQRCLLSEWATRLSEIQDIIGFNNGVDAALREGLGPVVTIAEQHTDAAESLTAWFGRAWYESIAETAFAERVALRDFDGHVHEGRIERFKEFDRESLHHNLARVTAAHLEGPTRVNDLPQRLVRVRASDLENGGEAGSEAAEVAAIRRRQQQLRVLQREIEKRSRHKPIRQLVAQAGEVIQELKPVFMMSPLSIATYLAPGSVKFDLTIFDEASQVRPVDALGALMRGEKAVVVGDSRQLPPTSFFDRVTQSDGSDDEDENVVSGIESILGLFSSRGAPSRQLRWHYRSRHESLIAVSNREFYDNNLMVFPSPDAGREATGLRWHHLPDAVFDRGKSRTNLQEAEAVARAVMEHAARSPELSLGVASFSVAQSQAIQDRLELLRRQDDSCEEFFAAHPDEPFFVKNLENVQGDERDVIFISIGYGRDASGQVSMNFGPLNGEGGERRLNVLITRAKQQCHVFTNLRSDDIDLNRTQSFGVRALKAFLAYAETGVMPVDVPYESDFSVDSPFQQEVAARLTERGYLVRQEVASVGKFIDIGIVDPDKPGRYLIGIECDGASYHSARSARDRDRLREEVLLGLGWKLHRVWSTDWFRNPDRELERAVEAIERAKTQSP